jgi:putative ABC transport system ATP-binding protein
MNVVALHSATEIDPRPKAVQLSRVRREYDAGGVRTAVLRGINLSIDAGSLTMILGASGSGKTTLLNIIGGIDKADAGEVSVAGVRLDQASVRELERFRQERIGFIFQFYNLMPTLTARENVEVALEHRPIKRKEREERAMRALESVGVAQHAHKFPGQMSGGEQQRVAIVRALVREPAILLCDEPTGNLDAESGTRVVALIDQLRLATKSTVIIVTHNPELFTHPDRIVRVRDGLVQAGS